MNLGTKMTRAGKLAHVATLDDVVDEYLLHFKFEAGAERSAGHHDPLIDFCREAPDLETAIRRAVDGRRRDGKMFSEGSCVRASSKEEFARELVGSQDALRARSDDFDLLHDLVRFHAPWGIGTLTVYNVTARIAAYFGTHPERHIYVHAGPLKGWKRLTGTRGNPYRVPLTDVPAPLLRLKPYQIEDLLCEFRDLLHPEMMRCTR